jgi:hypothetical protein
LVWLQKAANNTWGRLVFTSSSNFLIL